VLSEDAGWIVREWILIPAYALDEHGAHEDSGDALASISGLVQIEQPGTRISLGECVESECPAVRPRGGATVRKARA
jgi:hypothetical protein